MARVEFELCYYDVAGQHVSQYTTQSLYDEAISAVNFVINGIQALQH